MQSSVLKKYSEVCTVQGSVLKKYSEVCTKPKYVLQYAVMVFLQQMRAKIMDKRQLIMRIKGKVNNFNEGFVRMLLYINNIQLSGLRPSDII